MNWSSSTITGLSSDTGPTIVITFESGKYVFNVGEGTTRAHLQTRRGWKKVKAMFLTQATTERMGGMTSSMMAIGDASARQLDIVGPPGILHILASMRHFFYRETLRLNVHETPYLSPPSGATATATPTDPPPVFKDENITVWAIPLFSIPSSSSSPVPTLHKDGDGDGDVTMSTSDPLGSLKRKRDDSTTEDIPSKRPAPINSGSGAATSPSDAVTPSELTTTTITGTSSTPTPTQTQAPLLDRYRADPHNFPIHSLTGAEAEEWRKLTVSHMFTLAESEVPAPVRDDEKDKDRDARAKKGNKDKGKQQKKGKKGRADQPSATDVKSSEAPPAPPPPTTTTTVPTHTNGRRDRGPARFNPAKSFHQLPRFVLPSLSSSSSSPTTTSPSSSPSSTHPRSSDNSTADTSSTPSCAYVILGPRMRGRFNAQRADELGLKGPLRGRVSKGETVTFSVEVDDGKGGKETVERTVRPEECVGESEAPVASLIIDVPTPSHIPSLLAAFSASSSFHPLYAKFRSKDPKDHKEVNTHMVYHLLGEGVLEDERYGEFMRGFADGTYHMVSSRAHNADPMTFTSVALNQLRLNQLDPDMFPLLKYRLEVERALSSIPNLPRNTYPLVSNTFTDHRPAKPPVIDGEIQARDLFHPVVTSEPYPSFSSVSSDSSASSASSAATAPSSAPAPAPSAALQVELAPSTTEAYVQARERVRLVAGEREGGEEGRPGDDIVVIPTGTSSAVVSRFRNVSGLLIQLPKRAGYVIFDAGEGTWGQIVRFFGVEGNSRPSDSGQRKRQEEGETAYDVLRTLKCIFISHIHADHHAGLGRILALRAKLNPPPSDPLYLIAPETVHLHLRELSDTEPLGLASSLGTRNGVIPILAEHIDVVAKACKGNGNGYGGGYGYGGRKREEPEGYTLDMGGGVNVWYEGREGTEWKGQGNSRLAAESLCDMMGLKSIETVNVKHRVRAYGIVMTHRDGWRIVYSGDTLPTNNLVLAGQDATLLIHEATLADDQEEMAFNKAHTTVGQAVDIAKQMRAENVLLTHFSSRYPHMPDYISESSPAPSRPSSPSPSTPSSDQPTRNRKGSDNNPAVAIALDHARLRVGDMWKMQLYLKAIEKSFWDVREEGDEEEEEAVMRASMGDHHHH